MTFSMKKKNQKRSSDTRLKYCPFCGHDQASVLTWWSERFSAWGSQAHCDHCDASSSTTIGFDTRDEAHERAVENWNEAYRPSAFRLWLTRFPIQLRYDIEMFFENLRERIFRN